MWTLPVSMVYADSSDTSEHFLQDAEFSYYEVHNNPDAGFDEPPLNHVNGLNEDEKLPEFKQKKKQKKRSARRTKYFFTAGVNGSFRFDTAFGTADSYTNILGGLTGSIRFGMKGIDFNWSFEQQFGHIWGLKIHNGSTDMTRYDAATFIELSQSKPLKRHFSMNYTLGLGLLYNMPHSGDPGAYRDSFAVDDNGTNLAVSIKLGVGIVWYMTPYTGLGLNLNYIVGIDIASYLADKIQTDAIAADEEIKKNKLFVEMLQPGLLWIVKF